MTETGTESIEILATQLAVVNTTSDLIQNQIIKATTQFQDELKMIQVQEKELRAAILEGMKANGVKKFENDAISLTYIASTTRDSIDVVKLREAEPAIAEKYTRTSAVKESLRIKVKEQE